MLRKYTIRRALVSRGRQLKIMQACIGRVLQAVLFQNGVKHVYSSVRYNSNKAAVCRINRSIYVRVYPTMVVLPNGSTISVRYREPRKIIKLPFDLSTLSAAEREERLRKRKPKTKIVIEEDIEDDFDVDKYSHLWKKK